MIADVTIIFIAKQLFYLFLDMKICYLYNEKNTILRQFKKKEKDGGKGKKEVRQDEGFIS